jgi:phage baseplate assembly protein gpV
MNNNINKDLLASIPNQKSPVKQVIQVMVPLNEEQTGPAMTLKPYSVGFSNGTLVTTARIILFRDGTYRVYDPALHEETSESVWALQLI